MPFSKGIHIFFHVLEWRMPPPLTEKMFCGKSAPLEIFKNFRSVEFANHVSVGSAIMSTNPFTLLRITFFSFSQSDIILFLVKCHFKNICLQQILHFKLAEFATAIGDSKHLKHHSRIGRLLP